MEEAGQGIIVAGGRYVAIQPGKAEVAFVVTDEYQGHGIGAALLRHLTLIARARGLYALFAEVLSENRPMLRVFEKKIAHDRDPRPRGHTHHSSTQAGDRPAVIQSQADQGSRGFSPFNPAYPSRHQLEIRAYENGYQISTLDRLATWALSPVATTWYSTPGILKAYMPAESVFAVARTL